MKTIFRIILILLVATMVAGAFSLAVNNSSSTAVTSANGQSIQAVERPEGGASDGSSITGGLAGVLGTLAKLTGISIFVLLIQKIFSPHGTRTLLPAQR